MSRQVLADHVYEELLASLMDGRLEPGAAVSIDGTARELDVSPTPVREALGPAGAHRHGPAGGAEGLSRGPGFHPRGLRGAHGGPARHRAGQRPSGLRAADPASGSPSWNRPSSDLKSAPRGPSFAEYKDYLEADERFHQLIAQQTGNQFMVAAYAALGGQVQRFRLFGGVGITDAENAIAEHQSVLDAFSTGDPDKAEAAMADHVQKVRGPRHRRRPGGLDCISPRAAK